MSDRPKAPLSEPGEATSDPRRDLGGALHDVSNALTVLLGWIAEARSPGASAESLGYALRIIEERARAARDLARRAIGADVARTDSTDGLDAILAQTLDALAVEAQRAQVVLDLATPPTGERVPWASDLSQIVTNLVINALAYSPPGGTVRVHVELAPRGVHVDVEDEGPGIDEGRRTSIFEGDTTREGGAGVGLRHARAVARACGGDVELVPTPGGAFFRVTWPRVGSLPSVPPSAARSQTLQGMRVLVIEDDADVIALLETALGARGAELVLARNVAELSAATATPFDAALIDLSPIASDVEGAVARIRAGSPSAVLVAMTGNTQDLPSSLVDRGVACVRKPFEVGEIVAAITRRP